MRPRLRERVYSRLQARTDAKFLALFQQVMDGQRLRLVDVGAAGSISQRWGRVAACLDYVGFEPDERSSKALDVLDQGCASYTILPHLLAGQEGTTLFNLCRKPTVSSFYEPNLSVLKNFPDVERFDILDTMSIPCITLDSLGLLDVDLIKIDTQGSEKEILQGAGKTLSGCLGVEVEVEFLNIYKHQPLFGDVSSYLTGCGFTFIDFLSLHRWERQEFTGEGQAIFGDALFLRSPEDMALDEQLEQSTKLRWIGVCILYYRYDLIKRFIEVCSDPPLHDGFMPALQRLEASFRKRARLATYARKLVSLRGGPEMSIHLFY